MHHLVHKLDAVLIQVKTYSYAFLNILYPYLRALGCLELFYSCFFKANIFKRPSYSVLYIT